MSLGNQYGILGTTCAFFRGPIWRADVARLLGMLEVAFSVVMKDDEEQHIAWALQRIEPSLLCPAISCVGFQVKGVPDGAGRE
jgi:hypothetical protein